MIYFQFSDFNIKSKAVPIEACCLGCNPLMRTAAKSGMAILMKSLN